MIGHDDRRANRGDQRGDSGGSEDLDGTDGLDRLFAQARAARPVPPPALMSRVLADAATGADRRAAPPLRSAVRSAGGGLWRLVAGALGGGGALAGLASAALTGVWIGLAAPVPALATVLDPVLALAPGLWVAEEVELLPDVDAILSAGIGGADD